MNNAASPPAEHPITPVTNIDTESVSICQLPTEQLLGADLFLNREISQIQFHLRVLEQAKDVSIPLLERFKFLLIFSNILDEFFEIRIAGIKKQAAFGQGNTTPDQIPPHKLLKVLSDICHHAVKEQYRTLNDFLFPALREQKIYFVRRSEWNEAQALWVKTYFREQVLPVMSPIALDPAHPFPKTANKTLNFIVSLDGKDAFGRQSGLAIVPAPRSLPRLIRFPDEVCSEGVHFVFLSAMIHAHAEDLFPGMKVTGCYQFRVTRNADLHLNEEIVQDLAIALRGELLSRRYGDEVRLEVSDNCPENLSSFLLKQFNLHEIDLYKVNGMVNLARMMGVTQLNIPELKYPPFMARIPRSLKARKNIFESVSQHDILLHHPFESFLPVIDFLRQAASDPHVLAIKQTIYRIGADSELLDILVEAAKNGKEVTAVVELRARFDEESNLEVAAKLQKAGAIVAYGIVGFKTHSKLTLIVRREGSKLRRYAHLGTGNYHMGNAKSYTDFSLLTADESICKDVHKIFQQLTSMGQKIKLQHLLLAPFTLLSSILALIEKETQAAEEQKPAQLIIKVNSLTEKQIIEQLYKASSAGVKITLIVRGICSLKPGIANLSENIEVFSIVGRFLEHSRIYYFYAGGEEKIYLSSADWMERNLFHRLETAFPILDPKLKTRVLQEGLLPYCKDNSQSWRMTHQGGYVRKASDTEEKFSAQDFLLKMQ